MALTAVDPAPALIVVDLQEGVVAGASAPYPPSEVVTRSALLADAFRERGWPVVLVNAAGTPAGRTEGNPTGGSFVFAEDQLRLAEGLNQAAGDLVVTKPSRGAFHATALHDELQQRGVTQVFVTGLMTSLGVLETAQQAYAHGYHVVAVSDAMADLSEGWHEHSVTALLPTLSQVATTAEVLAAI